MATGCDDALGFEEIGQAGSQPSNLWLTGSIVAESHLSGADVYATDKLQGAQVIASGSVQSQSLGVPLINIGSPSSVGNLLIQAGSSETGAGSDVALAFPRAFSAVPTVVVAPFETLEDILLAGISAGSCVVETKSASQSFTWIAIGTK